MAAAPPTVAPAEQPPAQPPLPVQPAKNPLTKILESINTHTGAFTYAETLSTEAAHLSPYTFTSGLLIFSIFTLNYPLFVMSLTMFEAFLIRMPLTKVFQFFTPLTPSLGAGSQTGCSSGYSKMTPPKFLHFLSEGLVESYPMPSLYILSTAFTYTLTAMLQFKEELTALGQSYSNRPYLALLAGFLFLFSFSLFLFSKGCASLAGILLSVLVGAVVGFLLAQQNMLFSGQDRSSINLLFIPTMAQTTPKYVCANITS
jgi:hypothetical protein